MTSPKESEHKEMSFTPSLSVGVLLTYKNTLILIQDNNGKWGIPAGHAEPLENPIEVIKREIKEETGLNSENLIWHKMQQVLCPSVMWVAEENKTSLGVVYAFNLQEDIPNTKGWENTIEGEEIQFVKPFSAIEVIQLLENESNIRKSAFNVGQLKKWLAWQYNDTVDGGVKDQELIRTFHEWIQKEKNGGSFYTIKDPLNYHYLVYEPTHSIHEKGVIISTCIEDLQELSGNIVTYYPINTA